MEKKILFVDRIYENYIKLVTLNKKTPLITRERMADLLSEAFNYILLVFIVTGKTGFSCVPLNSTEEPELWLLHFVVYHKEIPFTGAFLGTEEQVKAKREELYTSITNEESPNGTEFFK